MGEQAPQGQVAAGRETLARVGGCEHTLDARRGVDGKGRAHAGGHGPGPGQAGEAESRAGAECVAPLPSEAGEEKRGELGERQLEGRVEHEPQAAQRPGEQRGAGQDAPWPGRAQHAL